MSSVDQSESKGFKSFAETTKKLGKSAVKTVAGSTKKAGSGVAQVWKDFKAFLDRGNVIDVAVALVMGAAFTEIVKSFVTDLFTPLIGLVINKSLSYGYIAMKCPPGLENAIVSNSSIDAFLKNKTGENLVYCKDRGAIQRYFTTPDLANKAGVLTWNWGNFLDKCISLLITATILFFVVKAYAAAFRRGTPKPKEKDCPHCLKKVPIKATRCFECTSELEEYVSEEESEPDEKTKFFKFPMTFKKKSSDKIDKVV